VWVTDAGGREIKGRLASFAPDAISVDAGGATQEFQAARVSTIRTQRKDPLRNGVLWGAGLGFVLGALSCGANPQCAGDEAGAGMAAGLGIVGAAAVAAIGAAVDAARKGPRFVVYRAPGATSARVSIAPVFTPRTKGAAITFSF